MSKHIQKLVDEIQLGIEDAQGDFPDVNPDDVVWEVANSMLAGHSESMRREVFKRLGILI